MPVSILLRRNSALSSSLVACRAACSEGGKVLLVTSYPMELRYGLLADYANATQEGKLNVIGIFDRLFAVSFPAVHRQLYLITCIETEAEDEGRTRELLIQLIDADGTVLTELRGQINFGIGKQVFNQIHVFQDLRFEMPGAYQFNLFFDGHMVKTLNLELQAVPPSPTVGSA